MQIKELGEFGVIELLNAMIVGNRAGPDNASPFAFRLLVDTGDDTAAWRAGEATELFTTDTVVEGVHFTRVTIPWRDLGWKSLASNISDIAAMGGLPLYALVTLGLPSETEVEDLRELYSGMLEAGNKYGVAVVGGDMVRSPVAFITVSLTGVHPGMPMLRSAARAGDRVAVTGPLGGSGGGLRLMLDDLEASPEAAAHLRRCHRRPEPAVAEGQVLAGAGVLAAMDVSDGLADDLSKLCLSSGLSARIFADNVPVHRLLKQAFPDGYLDLALAGGEDYTLLFTATPELMVQVMSLLPGNAAVVGEILAGEPGRVVVVDSAGRETVAGRGGWDHFR
jgi:thiamine-monophosphate kinase